MTIVRELANFAQSPETLERDLLPLLQLRVLGPDGVMRADAAPADLAYALQIISRTRIIMADSWEQCKTTTNASNSAKPFSGNGSQTNDDDKDIDPESFARLMRQFHDWYGI